LSEPKSATENSPKEINIESGKCYNIIEVFGSSDAECGELRFSCTGQDYGNGGTCDKKCIVNGEEFGCNTHDQILTISKPIKGKTLTTTGINTAQWTIECRYKN
jgi:hypothetical protein